MEINGRLFVRTDADMAASLFRPNGTAQGFYEKKRDGVLLLDIQRQPRVFIKFDGAGAFAVTASRINGRIRYMFGMTISDEQWLGMEAMTWGAKCRLCDLVKETV